MSTSSVRLVDEPRLFWLRVQPTPTGCWEWQGNRAPEGYGRLRLNGALTYVHRLVWRLMHDAEIPGGFQVCHRCDNPPCVRPDHLFLGTNRVNQHDRIAKGHGPVGLPGRLWQEAVA